MVRHPQRAPSRPRGEEACFKLNEVIRVGPAGWNYKDWAGIVYPAKRARGFSEPGYLANVFDTIEINTSFYGPPRPESAKNWLAAIAYNRAFKFTAKLWRGFTHERNATAEDESLFKTGIDPIASADRLGALLLQFPISFRNEPESLDYVTRLAHRFREYALVIEVRHGSWNDARVLDTFAELGIGICNIDQPLLGRALRPASHATSTVGYVRLHGRNYKNWFAENKTVAERYDYLYSVDELEPWADRVKAIAQHTDDVYAVTNNHNIGKAVLNGAELAAIITGKPLNIPPEWLEHWPRLNRSGRNGAEGGT